eukprot:tig00000803_g4318.t1
MAVGPSPSPAAGCPSNSRHGGRMRSVRPRAGSPIELVLPYVPAGLLAVKARGGARGSSAPACSSTSFSAPALTRSEDANASEKLTSSLNEYFLQLVRRVPPQPRGDAVIAFIGAHDRKGLDLRAAARLALDAALDIRSISFSRNGFRLVAHTAIYKGSGEMQAFMLQGVDGAAQAVFTGDLICQACEAQQVKDDEIVLSESLCVAEAIAPSGLRRNPRFCLSPAVFLSAAHLANVAID